MELFLFALDDDLAAAAGRAGLDGVVVDLERRGKHERQLGFDTGVSTQTIDDVRRIRGLTDLPLIVRVDGPGDDLGHRLTAVRDAGADEALVPMVRDAAAVRSCLAAAPDDLPIGVLVERVSAVEDAAAIGRLPLTRVYVGLMDLMVERGSAPPFAALVDGTVDRVRATARQPFGVGGLTAPGHGDPVPARLVAAELVRLRSDFTFLRRSFLRAAADLGVGTAVGRIRRMLEQLEGRAASAIDRDRRALRDRVLGARA